MPGRGDFIREEHEIRPEQNNLAVSPVLMFLSFDIIHDNFPTHMETDGFAQLLAALSMLPPCLLPSSSIPLCQPCHNSTMVLHSPNCRNSFLRVPLLSLPLRKLQSIFLQDPHLCCSIFPIFRDCHFEETDMMITLPSSNSLLSTGLRLNAFGKQIGQFTHQDG